MKKLIKPLCLLTGLLCVPAVLLHAQVDEKLKADIVSTGYVHSPLPLDETKAFETFGLKKKVLETVMLCDICLLYTSPSPRDRTRSRMPSSA